ncbi:MAG: A24 family peptidase C-terminal domain-containing protein [Candidatus Woesearchaeota archaeon]
MNLLWFFLPAIIVFGVITSYEDFKHRKIRNKLVVLALMYAFLAMAIVIILSLWRGGSVNSAYLVEWFFNMCFVLVAGLTIWFAGMWTAGDAKLFLAYAALVPLTVYQYGKVAHFPSFAIVVNTFTPFFIYFTVKVLIRTSWKEKLEITKDMLSPKTLLNFVVFVFAFYWAILFAVRFMPPSYAAVATNFFSSVIILFIILILLRKLLRINYLYLAMIIGLIGIIVDYRTILTSSFLYRFLITLVVFVFVIYFVVHLGFRMFAKSVYLEDLKPGMIPAENIVEVKGGYSKRKMVPISLISGLLERFEGTLLFKDPARGITEEEIAEVRKLHSWGRINDHSIAIYPTMSFAPFMFAGVILTLLARGDAFAYLRVLIEKLL